MIVNKRITEKYCIAGNRIWYAHAFINGLFYIDLNTNKVGCAGCVCEENNYINRAYSNIFYYKNAIYLIPFNADGLGIYHINDTKFEFCRFPENVAQKSSASILYEDYIYIFPYRAEGFYRFDLKNKEFCRMKLPKNRNMAIYAAVLFNKNIWFVEDKGKVLYGYSIEENQYVEIDLYKEGNFSAIGLFDNKIVVTAIDRATAVCIDIDTGEKSKINFGEDFNTENRNYFISRDGVNILLVKIGTNECFLIEPSGNEIKKQKYTDKNFSSYGMIWETEIGIAMLPTTEDKSFRFWDGRIINLDDGNAMKEWRRRILLDKKMILPDYGIKELIEYANLITDIAF